MSEEPRIPERMLTRSRVRDQSLRDPLCPYRPKHQPAHGVVVPEGRNGGTGGWLPEDFRYHDSGRRGAHVAVEDVRDREGVHHDLEVSREKIHEHRKALRDMTKRG